MGLVHLCLNKATRIVPIFAAFMQNIVVQRDAFAICFARSVESVELLYPSML